MSIKIPGVLSFQRGAIVTDGLLSSIVPTESAERLVPVKVIRHGIRGINNTPKGEDVANIQRTESAKTADDAIGLAVEFSYRTLPANRLLFGCSDPNYRRAAEGFISRFFVRGVPEFDEVCLRYARNILNGRWLWISSSMPSVIIERSVVTSERSQAACRVWKLRLAASMKPCASKPSGTPQFCDPASAAPIMEPLPPAAGCAAS